MQKQDNPVVDIFVTRNFACNWSKLASNVKKRAREKVTLLAENYRHPSLRTHPLYRSTKQLLSCYISKTERILYSREGTSIILHAIGKHDVIDLAHMSGLSSSKRFKRFDQLS